jgi:hypothetical protein
MIVLSFAGFLRFDELSSLKCNDVTVHDHVLKLKIVHSKTDQYRQGNDVLISKGNTLACPVSIFRHYVSLSKCLLMHRSFTPERAAADAPPDRKECRPKFKFGSTDLSLFNIFSLAVV